MSFLKSQSSDLPSHRQLVGEIISGKSAEGGDTGSDSTTKMNEHQQQGPNAAAAPAWERSKENAAPIRAGRKVAVLESAWNTSQEEKDRMLAYYEKQVKDSAEHPDPLVPWLELINFLQTFYRPSEPVPRDVLESCVLEFFSSPRYEQDLRYCKICCRYATLDAEPLDLFQQLHDRGIGTSLSVFWIAWAWQAETLKDYELARRVLEDGLHGGAQPWTQLSQRFQQFVRRQKRRERQLLEQQQQQDEEDALYVSAQQQSRGALGRLTESAIRRNDRTTSGPALFGPPGGAGATLASQSMLSTFTDRTHGSTVAVGGGGNGTNARQQGWQIHVDGEPSPASTALDRALARRAGLAASEDAAAESRREGLRDPSPPGRATLHPQSERRKENLQRAEAWNERGGLKTGSTTAAMDDGSGRFRSLPPSKPPSFEVFVDPEYALKHEQEERQRQNQLHQQQQRLRGGDFDVPQHHNHPTEPPIPRHGKKSSVKILWWDVPNAAFNKYLLMDSTGHEQCFEEARAISGCYRLLSIPPSPREVETHDSVHSSILMDESVATISTNDTGLEDNLKAGSLLNTSMASIGSQQVVTGGTTSLITPRNHELLNTSGETQEGRTSVTGRASNGGPTPTVNTKWALNQLSVMFYSPSSIDSANIYRRHPSSRGDRIGLDDMSSSFTESNRRDHGDSSLDTHPSNRTYKEEKDFYNSSKPRATVPPRHRPAAANGKQRGATTVAGDRGLGGFIIHRDVSDGSPDEMKDDNRQTQLSGISADVPSSVSSVPCNHNDLRPVASPGRSKSMMSGSPARSEGYVIYQDETHSEGEHKFVQDSRLPVAASAPRLESPSYPAEDPRETHRSKSILPTLSPTKSSGFVIYRDEDTEEDDHVMNSSRTFDGDATSSSPSSQRPSNNHFFVTSPDRHNVGDEDTASFSELGEAFDLQLVLASDGKTANFELVQELLAQPFSYRDDAQRPDDDHSGEAGHGYGKYPSPDASCPRSTPNEHGFTSYSNLYNERDGDTATFSEIGDALDQPLAQGHSGRDGRTANFDLIQELLDQPNSQMSFVSDDDLPAFGDVSCIALAEEYEPTNTYVRLEGFKAINYKQMHDDDTRAASRRLRERLPSRSDSAETNNLHELLSTQRLLRNFPIVPLPRIFKKASNSPLTSDRELRLGRHRFPILHELGRGAYGAVVLLDDCRGLSGSLLAVKGQRDTGSLAWEYEILERLHERFSRFNASVSPDLFPSPLSFVFLSDGALLGMSPALTVDKESLNLVDLVNVYVKQNECVDEILILYYTSRMLRTVELLHRRGRVLHCDAKPDNWVLVKSRDPKWVSIEASDLMLVDFGRAVDLECAKSLGVSQSDAQLVGDANCGRMKCVAMRRGLPWSYDVDTLGICASAYALLYAEHMELLQQSNGRWKPKDPHSKRRLGFTALWTYIFDKLLNVDAVSKIALDSRPSSLYTLQKQVVTLLDDRVAELKDALRKQMQLLRRVAPELRGDRKT